jgi:hypothetical protein
VEKSCPTNGIDIALIFHKTGKLSESLLWIQKKEGVTFW